MPEYLNLTELEDGDTVVIGRDPECDISVALENISGQHCRILARENGLFIRDLESRTGTYLNDVRVNGLQRVMDNDVISVSSVKFGVRIPERYSAAGCRVELRNVSVEAGKGRASRLILRNISLGISPGEFVGIVGPSGCGKSTLMGALAGTTVPANGQVLLDGVALDTESLRQKVGFLPQFVILHDHLTVKDALWYAKHLSPDGNRFRDLLPMEILDNVGLAPQANQPIRTLSGGQQKRAGLAQELLFKPKILCLDEVTSGLDPLSEKEMMILFKDLSSMGKTLLCITHYPDRLVLCDKLIVLYSGNLIFFGSPEETLSHFGIDSLADLYETIEAHDPGYWIGKISMPKGKPLEQQVSLVRPNPFLFFRQFPIQILRYMEFWRQNLPELSFLTLQGLIIGMLIGLCFGRAQENITILDEALRSQRILFALILASTWVGATTSVREIVKERKILIHEGRRKISPMAYILSKFSILSILSSVGVAILSSIVILWTEIPVNSLKLTLVLLLVASISSVLGLTVSALCNTQEKALSVLPVAVIGLALFSGGIEKLKGMSLILGKISSYSFWSFDLAKQCLSERVLGVVHPFSAEKVIVPPVEEIHAIAMLGVYLVFFLAISRFGIVRTLRKGN